MNHNHNECEHELKLCKQCDVVFCGKCGKEWVFHILKSLGGQLLLNQVWPIQPYKDPNIFWCENHNSTLNTTPTPSTETVNINTDDLEFQN